MLPDAPGAAPFGILLISGSFERAHYAFMLAAGAAAIGRRVVLFATNGGIRALCRDWSGLDAASEDAAFQAKGVAGLEELREAAIELGVEFLVCDAGLRVAGTPAGSLMPGVEVSGIPSFLSAVGAGQIATL